MRMYIFKCNDCGEIEEFCFSIKDHTRFSKDVRCSCGGEVVQLLESPKLGFIRTSFPKGFVHEHVSRTPVKLRDKKHFQEVCAENGMVASHYDGI